VKRSLTDGGAVDGEEQLQVDERYASRLAVDEMAPFRTLEERMTRFRRDTEARCKAETAAAVARVRELEVGQAKLDAAAQHRKQLAAMRAEVEAVHAEKLNALRCREENLAAWRRQQDTALEAAAFDHRQQMLREQAEVAERRDQMRREAEAREAAVAAAEVRRRLALSSLHTRFGVQHLGKTLSLSSSMSKPIERSSMIHPAKGARSSWFCRTQPERGCGCPCRTSERHTSVCGAVCERVVKHLPRGSVCVSYLFVQEGRALSVST
jgi:hypothetical protein